MESDQRVTSDFRLSALKKTGYIGALLRVFGPLGDRLLSLKKMEIAQGEPVMKYGEERSGAQEPIQRTVGPTRGGGAKLGDVLKDKLGDKLGGAGESKT